MNNNYFFCIKRLLEMKSIAIENALNTKNGNRRFKIL